MKRFLKLTACAVSLALAAACVSPALAASQEVRKDENVFVILNADGSVKEQIVSDWLHSDAGLSGAEDKSSLENIQVLKGDAAPTREGEALTWRTQENDVYYQGRSGQTPPVSAAITYTLNGEEKTAEELLGQSGHLKITIALQNNEKTQKEIGGKLREVYTPFATVVAADLPSGVFANVTAQHGTVQTDSSNQLACFVALPGLRQSFDGLLTGDLAELEDLLLDEVSIEADVERFEMPTILLACATSMEELQQTADLSGLSGQLDELTEGTARLAEAALTLDGKMAELVSSYGTFDAGVDSALVGSQQVKTGADGLLAGAGDLLDGAAALQAGSGALAASLNDRLVPQLKNAAAQQNGLQTDMKALNTKLEELKKGGVTLPDEAVQQVAAAVTPAVEEAFTTVAATAGGAASAETAAQIVARLAAQSQQYKDAAAAATANGDAAAAAQATATAAVLDNVIGSIQAAAADPSVQQAVAGSTAAAVQNSGEVAAAGQRIGAAVTGAVKAAAPGVVGGVIGGLQGDMDKVNSEAEALLGGMEQLTGALYNSAEPEDPETVVGAANAIAGGADAVNGGAAQLRDGAAQLSGGADSLAQGLTKLSSSSKTVKAALGKFKDGTVQLAEGAGALDGGVQGMAGAEELANLPLIAEIADEMQARANAYTSYTGAAEGTRASVKFVMKVEGPKAPQADAGEQAQAEQPTTFWERVKNLFQF